MTTEVLDLVGARKFLAQVMTERQLRENVRDMALKCGWYVAIWPAWRKTGTYAGVPDAEFCHPKFGHYMKMEFKREKARLTRMQADWVTALLDAGVETHVIRPSDWLSGKVHELLTCGRK